MTTRLVVLALALLAAVAPARADDDSGRTFAGSIQLDYLAVANEAHARQTTLDGATVELSLKLTKDFSKNMSATVKVCFACHGFEAGMAYIEMRAADAYPTPVEGAEERCMNCGHCVASKPKCSLQNCARSCHVATVM